MANLEIYDCTLREGEQAAGAHFGINERVELFKLLDEFGIDFIELGWPLASSDISECFEKCRAIRKNAKIVAFGSTSMNADASQDANLKSIIESKADYACIFGKSSKGHAEKQLGLSDEDNLKRIEASVKFLKRNNINVFYDAEHFFDAYKEDEEYALKTLAAAARGGAEKLILCDTNGGVFPAEAEKITRETRVYLDSRAINIGLGVHFHDDCGLALANTLACLSSVVHVQGTINGLGERIGGLNFSSFLPVLKKKYPKLNIDLTGLKKLNEKSYHLCGVEIPEIRPFVGDCAFAHKGGVHINATGKGASYEHANPEDYGNKRIILLNTLGGKSGVISVAREFGYELDKHEKGFQEKIDGLFSELRAMESKGYKIGAITAEQFLLIEKHFGNLKNILEVTEWNLLTSLRAGKEESEFIVKCLVGGKEVDGSIRVEGGPVDSAYKSLQNIVAKEHPEIHNLELVDFHVSIARYHGEESSVRTLITFKAVSNNSAWFFQTAGVDSNIIQSSVEAIVKGFRYYLNRQGSRQEKAI